MGTGINIVNVGPFQVRMYELAGELRGDYGPVGTNECYSIYGLKGIPPIIEQPPAEPEPGSPLDRYIRVMEAKLREHDETKGREGWLTRDQMSLLIHLLHHHTQRAREACMDCDEYALERELVHLGNYAMMIGQVLCTAADFTVFPRDPHGVRLSLKWFREKIAAVLGGTLIPQEYPFSTRWEAFDKIKGEIERLERLLMDRPRAPMDNRELSETMVGVIARIGAVFFGIWAGMGEEGGEE
jgi:hypothetical protein